jgi:polyhydroxyalkanoate synthase subunit PhaC
MSTAAEGAEPRPTAPSGTARPSEPADEAEATGNATGAEAVGIPSFAGLVKGVASVVAQPGPLRREVGRVAREQASILLGTSSVAPSPKDKRFGDPTWTDNPGYRRLGQSYLSLGAAMGRLVDAYEAGAADWHDVERARFAVQALTSLLAPTNTLLGNPAALKRAFETGGRSVTAGLANLLHDVRHNGGMPSQTDRTAFTVGQDLAVTKGVVVHRDEVAEVIEYAPTTPSVRSRPLLVVPPPIGRFYFLDLRPGRSFVEHAVDQGLHVFLISWRNPTAQQSGWDLDTYARRVVGALDVVKQISGSRDVNTLGFCAGGIILTTVLNHLAHTGDDSVHSAGYAVTLLDFDSRAPIGAFSSPRLLELARRGSERSGIITAQSLGAVFSWMRPDDLVFGYLVRQWLMGEDPPVFDILAWNADGTNLPARLHAQFLDIFRNNTLVAKGALEVLGTPLDVSAITLPTFVTGAVNDHLTPWEGCYRTTTALSGPSTFVLSNAGHIASLVNPPGNPRASYLAGPEPGPDAHAWRAAAEQRTGSWWTAWSAWTLARSGAERPAPASPGSAGFPPLEPAPGRYVLDRVPPAEPPVATVSPG